MSTICSPSEPCPERKPCRPPRSVDVLVEDVERGEHFHQLFRYLRLRNQSAEISIHKMSGAQSVFLKVPDLRTLFHQQRHKNIGIENLHYGADFGKMLHAVPPAHVPASQRPQTEVLAGPRRAPPPTTGRAPAGEEGASVAVARRAPRAPLPRPLPSSDLMRYGVGTWQGPLRRSGVRAAGTA